MLAKRLKSAGIDTVFSYAGRTGTPIAQPVPTRVGGFGGVDGLSEYIATENITHIVDATHPFAAGMSRNAHSAAQRCGVALIRMERPIWTPQHGDNWQYLPYIETVPSHLPDAPTTIFLAIGKQHLNAFAARPEHHYVLRLVDAPERTLPLPNTTILIARGPFTYEGDLALMREHGITHIVAKNAGGTAARAKLDAARTLGLPVLMVDRPALPKTTTSRDIGTVISYLHHGTLRGV